MGPLYRIRIEAESTAFKAQDPHVKRLARTIRDLCRYCEEIEKVSQKALQQVT